MRKLGIIFSGVALATLLGAGSVFADPFSLCVRDKNGRVNRGNLGTIPAKGACKNDKWQQVILSTETTPVTETVSFGQWLADAAEPVDRLTANPPRGGGNNDEVLPPEVVIKQGGAVNFIIAGLHNVQVYNDGKTPENVSTENPLDGERAAGGIIDDEEGRIYRGPDPNREDVPRDRVEVVKFPKPGVYLVICGVVNHFVNEQMWGIVRVLPEA